MPLQEGARVRGPNGEIGIVRNGEIVVVDKPQEQPAAVAPPALRQVVAAPAKEPPPQTPTNAALDEARLVYERQQPQNTAFDNERNFAKEFNARPEVQNYQTILPQYTAAIQAADNKAGDLQLVYAFSKIMDPGSVVREGEVSMASDVGGAQEQVKGYLAAIGGKGRLTPEQRKELTGEIRTRASQAADAYNLTRQQFGALAKVHGFDPNAIIGPHPGTPFQQAEADFLGRPVRNLDKSLGPPPHSQTSINPMPLDPEGIGSVGFFAPKEANVLPPGAEQFRNDFMAAIQAGKVKTADDIIKFNKDHGFNVSQEQAQRAADFIAKGGMPSIATPKYEAPNISDVRSPEADQKSPLQRVDAYGRGVADTLTMGTADKLAAAVDTIFNPDSTFKSNLARQYAISDYDTANHPYSRFTGQLAGGAALPMGDMSSLAQVVGKSAALGTAYGAGSSRSLADVPGNALLGAGAGGTTALGLGLGVPVVTKGGVSVLRRFVGPSTPQQNALLNAATAENVPINMSDAYPGARNTVATLETIPGSAGPVQRNIAAGRDAMANRVADLGQGGTVRGEGALGERVRKAGERFIDQHRDSSTADYGLAKRLGGDVKAPPVKAAEATRSVIGDLSETANINRSTLSLYKDILGDFLDEQGNLKPLSIDAMKGMRRAIRREMGSRGLIGSQEDTDLQKVVDAASQDMFDALNAHDPRAAAAYRAADEGYAKRMDYIHGTLQTFMGTEDKPVSGEALVAKMKAMAGSGSRGNSRQLNSFMGMLNRDEKADVAATLAAGLGRRSPEEPFSPATFINSVRGIDERARIIYFGRSGARSINNLMKLAEAKKDTVNRLNNSRSGQTSNYKTVLSTLITSLPGGGAILGLAFSAPGSGAALATGVGAAGLASSRALAKAMMNENFTRLLAEAPATTNPAVINRHFGKLRQLAVKDPGLREAVQAIEQRIIQYANDNVGQVSQSAAGNNEKDQQNQR